jgi:hypothetical protein
LKEDGDMVSALFTIITIGTALNLAITITGKVGGYIKKRKRRQQTRK